ncbi:hypothetical protein GCM10025734_82930 [Kitasatospora paranensis]
MGPRQGRAGPACRPTGPFPAARTREYDVPWSGHRVPSACRTVLPSGRRGNERSNQVASRPRVRVLGHPRFVPARATLLLSVRKVGQAREGVGRVAAAMPG